MHTVLVTNNAYDSILLVDASDAVMSCWTATPQNVFTYLVEGASPNDWEMGEFPTGFAPEDAATPEDAAALRTIATYGTECGRNGQIDSQERRQFWGL